MRFLHHRFQSVCFDMDGVLADTEKLYLEALKQYLASLNHTVSIQELTRYLGMSMHDICRQLKQDYHIHEALSEIRAHQLVYYDRLFYGEGNVKPMPGLLELINVFKQHDIQMAVVSSSSLFGIKETLRMIGMENTFDLILSTAAVERGKPFPDVYLLALEQMNQIAEEVLVIEDSMSGIQAAKQAHTIVIGYKGSEIQQDTSLADYEVASYHELLTYLQS